MDDAELIRKLYKIRGKGRNDWPIEAMWNSFIASYKVYQIAEMIGYSDYKYFSMQFKKYVSLTPKEYRNQGRRETDQQ